MFRFLKLFSLVAVLGMLSTGAMANTAHHPDTAVHETESAMPADDQEMGLSDEQDMTPSEEPLEEPYDPMNQEENSETMED